MTRPTKTQLYTKLSHAREMVPIGNCYRHQSSGDLYEVVLHSIREDDGEVLTSYTDGLVSFTRPHREWFEIVALPGGAGPRFRYISWEEARRG